MKVWVLTVEGIVGGCIESRPRPLTEVYADAPSMFKAWDHWKKNHPECRCSGGEQDVVQLSTGPIARLGDSVTVFGPLIGAPIVGTIGDGTKVSV